MQKSGMVQKIPEYKERDKAKNYLEIKQRSKNRRLKQHRSQLKANDSSFFTTDVDSKLKTIMIIAAKKYGDGRIWPSNESKNLSKAILDPNSHISKLKEMVQQRSESKENPNSRLLDCIRKEVDKNMSVGKFEDIFNIEYQSACIGQGVYSVR